MINKPMEKLKIEDFKEDNQEEVFNYEEMFKECFVDLDIVIDKPPCALSIGTFGYNNEDLSVHTYGEFSATVAPSKTKKSYYKSALIASYIGGNANNMSGRCIRILGLGSDIVIRDCFFNADPDGSIYVNITGTNTGIMSNCHFGVADVSTNRIVEGGIICTGIYDGGGLATAT